MIGTHVHICVLVVGASVPAEDFNWVHLVNNASSSSHLGLSSKSETKSRAVGHGGDRIQNDEVIVHWWRHQYGGGRYVDDDDDDKNDDAGGRGMHGIVEWWAELEMGLCQVMKVDYLLQNYVDWRIKTPIQIWVLLRLWKRNQAGTNTKKTKLQESNWTAESEEPKLGQMVSKPMVSLLFSFWRGSV